MSKFWKYIANVTEIDKAQNAAQIGIRGVKAFATTPINLAADGAVEAGKLYNKAMPLTKKTEESIANLWTGRREGRGAIAAAAVAGTGYAAYSSFKQTALAPKTGTVSYGGTAPVMDADGVSSTSQAPTLGANGNMIFGLHNARKG